MTKVTINVGIGASAADLQAIIDSAPSGATISLSAGTYVFDRTVVLDRSDLTLVGAGSELTTIVADPRLGDAPAIRIGHDLHLPGVTATHALASDAALGDTVIRLAPGHGVQAGDFLYLTQDNTKAFLDSIGDTDWRQESNLRAFLVQVRSVDGDTVTLADPLNFDFEAAATEVQERVVLENVTVGGLTVRGGWGVSDPSDFSNTRGDLEGSSMILVAGTSGARLSDIVILEAASHGLTVADSRDLSAEGITVNGALNKGVGGNGYGIWLRDVYDSAFHGLEITDTRHAVLFASYESATGNTVQVDWTNRDINFHGGRDHDNTVTVENSIRTGAEAAYLGSNLFFNEGTSYGAPTDAGANSVTFRTVVATVRSDLVFSDPRGSDIRTGKSADIVHTGTGDDRVLLGSGHDLAYASVGMDALYGNSGLDTIVFEGGLSRYETRWEEGTLVVSDPYGETRLAGFETAVFGGKSLDLGTIGETLRIESRLFEPLGGEGLAVLDGGDGWERVATAESVRMGPDLNALRMLGEEDLAAVGNESRNHVLGNGGDNRIEGGGGNDRLVGMFGDDLILGGEGDDFVHGHYGDDTLLGGAGEDTLTGYEGADSFVATEGRNVVADFSPAEGDRLVFNRAPEGAFEAALESVRAQDESGSLSGSVSGGGFTFEAVTWEGEASLEISSADGDSLLLVGVTLEDLLL